MSTPKLEGKVAIVTGASRGLGRAITLALAAEGARCALVARDNAKLESVAAEVFGLGGEAKIFTADVSREESVSDLEKEIAAAYGKANILINNAGINIRKKLVDFSLAEWNSVQESNVTSVFLMCRAFVPHMLGSGYGRVLNLCSIMSHVSLPERSAYSTSKTALLGLTRALALELAPDGITVNGISPGPFGTEMNLPIMNDPERNVQFVASVPVGRWGKPEEVGSLAVYLCAPEAGFITGTDILIDGGWCAR